MLRANTFRPCFLATLFSAALVGISASGQSPAVVIRNAHILTMSGTLNAPSAPIDGYMSVAADGTIMDVVAGEPPASLHAGKVIDARGDFMIPGFISAHSHIWQAAWRGLAEDQTEPGWGRDLYSGHAVRGTPEDFYWFCLYGSLDHLEHGITTAFDFVGGGAGRASTDPDPDAYNKAQFKAKIDSGIRFEQGFGVGGGGGRASGTAGGTAGTASSSGLAAASPVTLDQARARIQAFLAWTAKQPSSQFLGLMLTAGGPNAAPLMKEFHIGDQPHYLEAPDNEGEQRANFLHTYVDTGALGPGLYFGHFIHTDDYILQQTAKAGAGMSWNPLSNGRLASGTADIPKYLKMGVRVGMGVDGEASADLADPFENMRTGLYAIRDKYENAKIMSPYQVMWLQTMGSADIMGIKEKVGSLETHKFADFLLINPARLGPVLEDPYANIVFVASELDIDGVYIGGEPVVEHNKFLHQDFDKVHSESDHRVIAIK